MTYYSHSKKDKNANVYGSKHLIQHIDGVRDKAFFHLHDNLDLGYKTKDLRELLKIAVNFHDLGKYTTFFQNYLLDRHPFDLKLKRHAQIGGLVAFNLLAKEEDKKSLLSLYLIFLHHSSLIDIQDVSMKLGDDLKRIFEKQKDDLQNAIDTINKDLSLPNLKEILFYSEERKIRRGFKYWSKKYANIQDYFLINYMFSLLIEADKLDASDALPYKLKTIEPNSVDERFGKPTVTRKNLNSLSNNELRNYCRSIVVDNLKDKDILDQYVFTLTAPTGIGKTMTALDFSLKLKRKLRVETGIEPRIIYALPFINIIEQALHEYNETLSDQNIKILGHYQYADVFGDNKQKQSDDGAEQNYNQKLMALDTWQADIVITSFVQFFETLISNRNKLLKKFNHFANAIIILDEVQTLRLDQMPLLGSALFYLSKFLKSRIILMTATRPKIFELAQQEILNLQKDKVETRELLTNYEEVFSLFKRTAIHSLLNELKSEKENRVEEFTSTVFKKKWSSDKSCLIVSNTVRTSIELHQKIKDFLKYEKLDNPIYYLSTNIIPVHRLERIQQIKKDIENNKAPILIATQVVEAGVDLDFDLGFRDIGPIDSIIQVAGRINRNNNPEKIHSPLYIINLDEKATKMVYGRLTYIQAKKALEKKNFFNENEYLELITQYFDDISERSSFAEARSFFNSMKGLKYDSDDKSTFPISAFRIIEESGRYAAVFVETDDHASEILEKYLQKITNEISKEEFNKGWKLKFQQHIISVPKYLCEDLKTVNEYEESILLIPKEEIKLKYDLNTGYNRNYKETNQTFSF